MNPAPSGALRVAHEVVRACSSLDSLYPISLIRVPSDGAPVADDRGRVVRALV